MILTSEIPLAIWILSGVFSLISIGLAVVTMSNVIRLRSVRISWKAGRLMGYPLFSTLFLGVITILMSLGLYQESVAELAMASLYMVLAAGWFVTSYLASKRYITNHGIVKNVNDPSQTVAWHQIRDFLEHETDDGSRFVFIYSKSTADTPGKMVRLELHVPDRKLNNFKNLISHKLGRRITCYEMGSIKVEHFD